MNYSELSLKELYGFLRPIGLSDIGVKREIDKLSIEDLKKSSLLDPRGKFTTWSSIKNKFDSYYTDPKNTNSKTERHVTGLDFHAISSNVLDMDDAAYWGNVKSISDIAPRLNDSDLKKNDCNVSAFITRSHVATPATRGTDDVEFFLNNIPPVIASQMVPYLDVELEFLRPYFSSKSAAEKNPSQSTPSLMRFLVGSTKYSELSTNDSKIALADFRVFDSSDKSRSIPHSYSGMELFLSPQTLTNMDGLLPNNETRLVRAKPFVPFASIEGFDITIQNAGAGAFAHKKGSLKLKLHDKSRISEFSELIRGGPGFNSALLWTTYGWVAPMGRHLDEYSNFINDNMIVRDCWQVINSQFTFDVSGQVSFTLEMVSKATRSLQQLTLDRGTGADEKDLRTKLQRLEKLLIEMQDLRSAITSSPKFTIDVTSEQVLNAAATTGDLGGIAEIEAAIANLERSVGAGVLSEKDITTFKKDLALLKSNSDAENPYIAAQRATTTFVQKKLSDLSRGPDPFLPDDKNGEYFPDNRLAEEIKAFKENTPNIDKAINDAIEESKKQNAATGVYEKIDLTGVNRVVSFGKLFLNMVAPGIVGTGTCNELQIFFYNLNDQCGPLSNHSIAEFPIDLNTLSYTYSQAIKEAKTDVLTIEQFLKVIVNTQFADIRSIGYGMNRIYKIGTPNKPAAELNDSKESKSAHAKWTGQYGGFKPPALEFIVETGEEGDFPKNIVSALKKGALRYTTEEDAKVGTQGGSKRFIKRIHIYDKQSSPHWLMQQFIDSGNGSTLERGFLDKGRIEQVLKSRFAGIDQAKIDSIKLALQGKRSLEEVNDVLKQQGIGAVTETDLKDIYRRPGKNRQEIPRNRKTFKDELQRFVPTISIGTNGTMIITANIASKTDGTQGAINISNSLKGNINAAGPESNGLEDSNHLPLRVVPMGLSMTTQGCPIASLYQEYFIDFDTGTTIDNLYKCNTIAHSITPGKFTTSWGFIYTNGYGKFGTPPTKGAIVAGAIDSILDDILQEIAAKQKAALGGGDGGEGSDE